MGIGAVPDLGDPAVVVGRLAVALGREGAAGLPGALALLVEGCGLRSAVLRSTDGELLAVGGEVVQAVPARRRGVPSVVQLAVRTAGGDDVATLTVTGGRPSALPVVRAATGVLALALAAPAPVAPTAAALLLDAQAALDALADDLHDGPVQALVAARYAADLAVRGGDPADVVVVREAVQTALVAVRRTLAALRPRGADGLGDALEALATRLAEAGGPTLTVRPDAGTDATWLLAPAQAVTAYRLVQAVARAAAPGDGLTVGLSLLPGRRPTGPGRLLLLTVDGTGPLPDAGRWRRTAAALGGDLLVATGRVRLALPVPDTSPSRAADLGTAATTKAVL